MDGNARCFLIDVATSSSLPLIAFIGPRRLDRFPLDKDDIFPFLRERVERGRWRDPRGRKVGSLELVDLSCPREEEESSSLSGSCGMDGQRKLCNYAILP